MWYTDKMTKIKSPFSILRSTVNIFNPANKEIFYPYIIIVFISLVALEIFYFLPRFPLSIFFGPIISRIWEESYLHYPMNLILLPKMFLFAQTLIYLFISGFLITTVILMVSAINNDARVSFKVSFRKALPLYVYILLYTLLTLAFFQLFDNAYGLLIKRAIKIHSTTGIFFLIKKFVFWAAPYVQFLYGIIVTAFFIYIPILIVLEQKKFLGALAGNLKIILGSFWMTFMIILIPTLSYLPLLLLRDNIGKLAEITSPDIQVFILALSIFITNGINMFITAAATTYYLYQKEQS